MQEPTVNWLQRWRYADGARTTPLAAMYTQPLPALTLRFLDAELLALDIETTGLNPATDRVLSIGWVLLQHGRICMRESGHLLINSSAASVGHSATIHGLLDADMANGISIRAALEKVLPLLCGRVLVAHCALIETQFIARMCLATYRAPPLFRVVDTMAIEAQLRSHQHDADGALRLHACRERYQLPRYRSHNAAVDALACAELLLAQASRVMRIEKLTLGDLCRRSR